MSSESESVKVPFEGKPRDKAILLLAAAEELNLPATVVQATDGAFIVPAEVEKKAFEERSETPKKSAKKAAPKKAQE